jgi:hypothetical protein
MKMFQKEKHRLPVGTIHMNEVACIPLDAPSNIRHNLRMKTVKLFLALSLMGLTTVFLCGAETPTPDPALYGPYPKAYKDIVLDWLQKTLVDANSAKITWEGEPTPADLIENGQHLYGWRVNFSINSRSRLGAYTGRQKHGVLIRNGEVVKGIGFAY